MANVSGDQNEAMYHGCSGDKDICVTDQLSVLVKAGVDIGRLHDYLIG